MVNQMHKLEIEEEKIIPWWERSKVYEKMWRGWLFDRMILKGEDQEEQRIQRLREKTLERPQGKRGYLSIWRAKLLTDSYRKTEGESPALRKAKAFKHICEYIPINHQDGQLIMGEHSTGSPGAQLEPEWMGWLGRSVFIEDVGKTISEIDALEVREPEAWIVTNDDKKLLKEYIIPYWRDINHESVVQKQLEQNFPAVKFKEGHFVGRVSYPFIGFAYMHTIADYASVLRKGLSGIKEEIKSEMDKVDASNITSSSEIDRINIYKSMLIAADAIVIYANRCADMAEELASNQTLPKRRAEFAEMARICRKVPEYPAKSWWEAIQSLFFLWWAVHMCDGGAAHGFGRFDQYMYPYLKKDLETGKLDKKQAQELLECFFIKIREKIFLLECRAAKRHRALHNQAKINYGGIDSNGQDVTNDLSYMLLEAHAHTHSDDPEPTLRIHKNTPDTLLKATLEVLRLGTGAPHIINDEVIIPGLMRLGIPLHEARNYADIGCQENAIDPNTSGVDTNPHPSGGWFNLPKLVELVLFNGIERMSKEQVGPKTGDPRTFKSMEDFFEAVRKQAESHIHDNCIYNNLMDWAFVNCQPVPVINLLHPGPRQSGIDYQGGGCKYNWNGIPAVGLGLVADSLAAIEWLVYDKKETSMDQLVQAIDSNWVGYEDIRQKCLNAPKYGNDNDYADKWAVRLSSTWMDIYEKYRRPNGGICVGGFFSIATYVFMGSETWASANGRRTAEPLSAATDPCNETRLDGPTALHKSAAKIDTWRTTNGIALNCKFPPLAVSTERDISKWADLVRSYILMGGQAVQYNVIDSGSLKAAQLHPEDYKDLIVRIGGYSAVFVELDKETQDTIIGRTEHQL